MQKVLFFSELIAIDQHQKQAVFPPLGAVLFSTPSASAELLVFLAIFPFSLLLATKPAFRTSESLTRKHGKSQQSTNSEKNWAYKTHTHTTSS